jgi:hypothetical protein
MAVIFHPNFPDIQLATLALPAFDSSNYNILQFISDFILSCGTHWKPVYKFLKSQVLQREAFRSKSNRTKISSSDDFNF